MRGFGGGGIYLGFIFAVYQKYSALYSGVSLQMARHLRWGLLLHAHMARGDAARPIWMSGGCWGYIYTLDYTLHRFQLQFGTVRRAVCYT